MASVGIRELRQRASALLRRVEAGETIEVTDRGRPVAVLAPAPQPGPLDRLRSSGDVTPATAPLEGLPEAIALGGDEAPSQVLERLRSDER
ncbi:MAG: type II toxin-antitoxin system Phd/YefM family antitoxin [Candidatus Dormibacteria bacterium]